MLRFSPELAWFLSNVRVTTVRPILSFLIIGMLLFLFNLEDCEIRLVKYKKRKLRPNSGPQTSKLTNVFKCMFNIFVP